jgi:AcrR family transcriptional regulator
MAESTRERILEATLTCVGRHGMAKTTMDDIAREADLARATLYRAFPGGRDEVLDAVVTWEVARFFERLRAAIEPDGLALAEILERGLLAARDAMEHHDLLQRLLREEADQLVPSLAVVMPLVVQALADWLRPRLEAEPRRPGVDPAEGAELLARLALSYLSTPGRWDLTDPAEVHRLVHDHLLATVR